ncbi:MULTISPECIES: hypothetical protein [unclassified Massilia]|nr:MULTISPECIES: hypothetical protein [unclassified Massilia]
MKFIFGRREKFLYRRNPAWASFMAGTRFGVIVVALVLLYVKFN